MSCVGHIYCVNQYNEEDEDISSDRFHAEVLVNESLDTIPPHPTPPTPPTPDPTPPPPIWHFPEEIHGFLQAAAAGTHGVLHHEMAMGRSSGPPYHTRRGPG